MLVLFDQMAGPICPERAIHRVRFVCSVPLVCEMAVKFISPAATGEMMFWRFTSASRSLVHPFAQPALVLAVKLVPLVFCDVAAWICPFGQAIYAATGLSLASRRLTDRVRGA